MGAILSKTFIYVFIIFLGYGLKKAGLFHKEDSKILFKFLVNIIIPAMIVNSFASVEMDSSLLLLIFLAIALNLIGLLLGFLFSRKKDTGTRALYMFNISTYNIGSFSLPLVQNFFTDAYCIMAVVLFDFGNGIMCTGTNKVVGQAALKVGLDHSKSLFSNICTQILHSAPCMACIVMVIVRIFGISLPTFLKTTASTIGSCTGVVAMFCIGLMFEIRFQKEFFRRAFAILGIRYLFAAVTATGIYFLLPYQETVRQALALMMFSPLSSFAPIFTDQLGGDSGMSSFIQSLSIPFGMLFTVLLMNLFLTFAH